MIGSRPAMQKHTMRWDDLRVFLAVARHSRLQTAGRTLGLDPTTAGRRIAALEAALGAKLFDRSPEGYALTEAGRGLVEHAQAMESVAGAAAEEIGGHADRLSGTIRIGAPDGASNYLLVDGRGFRMQGYEDGFFVGACLFDRVTPEMDIYREEIFGPVLTSVRAKSYDEAIDLTMSNPYGNGTAIYTRDGDTARDFASRINVGMVGVNVPIPVPLAYHTFGGWKKSGFGDLNQHGPDAFRFYTRTKTVTARWPSGIKEGAAFSIPTME